VHVERRLFLAWTAALAFFGCRTPEVPIAVVDVPDAEPSLRAQPAPLPPPFDLGHTCNNEVGNVGDCSTLHAPCVEGLRYTIGNCERYAKGFKPRIAEKIVACILESNGSQALCTDIELVNRCARPWMSLTCVEPETRSRCEAILEEVKKTKPRTRVTVEDCMLALSSAAEGGESGMIACMVENDGFSEFWDTCLPFKLPPRRW
jgi:hypothetical protein